MKEINNILFPVDLSEASPRVAVAVETMAAKFEAGIHLLFVARVFEHFTSIYVPHPSIDKFEREMAEGAKRRLSEFREDHFNAFPAVHEEIRIGRIPEEIVRYAEEKEIDLLIMGTHGRTGLDRAVFGSVAERVVRSSAVPVMLVNPYRIPS
jgi:nucleotide-binding universal stress UspA family protein